MTAILLAGAAAGLGLLLLVARLLDSGPSGPVALARLDADRRRQQLDTLLGTTGRGRESLRARRLGAGLADVLAARGVSLDRVRADLAVTSGTVEGHLAGSLVTALVLAVVPVVLFAIWSSLGLLPGALLSVPIAAVLAGGLLGAMLPTLVLRQRAATARAGFRHTVGAFLDLVALNLAGGRGVPEALQTAVTSGGGPDMAKVATVLENARLQGITPWAALGQLGQSLGVDELVDLAAALSLVAGDGAKVRESLSARAASLRRKELAELEAEAEQRSQSLLVAQVPLAAGFLIFLMYPAVVRILEAL